MSVTETFTLRISPEDRKIFAELQRLFKRSSQSDAIRFVAREAVKAFQELADNGEEKTRKGANTKKN